MSMRSRSLESTISRFPEERESLKRLESLLKAARGEPEYTFEHLYREVRPSSPEVFTLILSDLAGRGLIKRLVRVESPVDRGGIADFESVTEVPDEIRDWRTDTALRVQPENLRIIFKIPSSDR